MCAPLFNLDHHFTKIFRRRWSREKAIEKLLRIKISAYTWKVRYFTKTKVVISRHNKRKKKLNEQLHTQKQNATLFLASGIMSCSFGFIELVSWPHIKHIILFCFLSSFLRLLQFFLLLASLFVRNILTIASQFF